MVTLTGNLEGEFFPDAIRGAGDDGPAAFGAELGELRRSAKNTCEKTRD